MNIIYEHMRLIYYINMMYSLTQTGLKLLVFGCSLVRVTCTYLEATAFALQIHSIRVDFQSFGTP